MVQIKIYGIKEKLTQVREKLSEVIHKCVVEALQFPKDKRAHRFFLMEKRRYALSGWTNRFLYNHRNIYD